MQTLKKAAVVFLALTGMTAPLVAAPICATETDMAAFRTAAVQQQLMVAALTCHDIDAYNRFVVAYRPELQKSDADLKAYFIRQGDETQYDTFKTKLANLSSLSDIANGPAYCANAGAAFDMALRSRQSLASFVADQRLMIALPQRKLCEARPDLASASAPARLAALPRPLARPPVRLQAPEAAVDGVPSHDLPATPYGDASDRQYDRTADASDRQAWEDQARSDQARADRTHEDYDDQDMPLPPRPQRPRAYRQYSPDSQYEEPSYPPSWWPRDYGRRWYDDRGF